MTTNNIFVLLLTFVFVVAKIMGYIHWSWWLVFLPIIAYVGVIFFIIFAIFGVGIYFAHQNKDKIKEILESNK